MEVPQKLLCLIYLGTAYLGDSKLQETSLWMNGAVVFLRILVFVFRTESRYYTAFVQFIR